MALGGNIGLVITASERQPDGRVQGIGQKGRMGQIRQNLRRQFPLPERQVSSLEWLVKKSSFAISSAAIGSEKQSDFRKILIGN